jgi:hypothetical protein
MYFEGTVASEIYKVETPQRERQAALKFRTRHMKTPESRALTAVVTNVLRLFIR